MVETFVCHCRQTYWCLICTHGISGLLMMKNFSAINTDNIFVDAWIRSPQLIIETNWRRPVIVFSMQDRYTFIIQLYIDMSRCRAFFPIFKCACISKIVPSENCKIRYRLGIYLKNLDFFIISFQSIVCQSYHFLIWFLGYINQYSF